MAVAHENVDSTSPKPTPLPVYQLFIVYLMQFTEPLTACVIYPFVNQFVRDTGVIDGDERKTGYYAGIIVSRPLIGTNLALKWTPFAGFNILSGRSCYCLPLGRCLRSVRPAPYPLAWTFRAFSRDAKLWPVGQILDASRIPLYPRNFQWKYWCGPSYYHRCDVIIHESRSGEDCHRGGMS